MKPKQLKRVEAEERNAATPHDKTKAHRLGRCSCNDKIKELVRTTNAPKKRKRRTKKEA
jgi:hypothetical protein